MTMYAIPRFFHVSAYAFGDFGHGRNLTDASANSIHFPPCRTLFFSDALFFSSEPPRKMGSRATISSSIRQPYAYRHLMLRQTFQIFAQPPAAASPQPDHFAFLAASRLSELFIAQKIKQPGTNARPLRIIRKRFSRAAPTGILLQNLKLSVRRLPECDVFAGLVNKQGFPDFQSINIFLCSFKRRNSRLRLYAGYNF